MGGAAARTRCRGCVRPHAGRPLSPYRAIPALAQRQKAYRLHLCATGGCSAAGTGRDFPNRPLTRVIVRAPSFRLILAKGGKIDCGLRGGGAVTSSLPRACAPREILASGRRRDREFLAQAASLLARFADSLEFESMSSTARASHRPAHHRRPGTRLLFCAYASTARDLRARRSCR